MLSPCLNWERKYAKLLCLLSGNANSVLKFYWSEIILLILVNFTQRNTKVAGPSIWMLLSSGAGIKDTAKVLFHCLSNEFSTTLHCCIQPAF